MVSSVTANQGVTSIGGWLPAADFVSPSLKTGAGSTDMNVDGSGTAVPFLYSPPPGCAASVMRLILFLETSTAMDTGKFGDLAALTNGVKFQIVNGGTTDVIETWKTNEDILLDMYDFSSAGAIFGKTTKVATGRWSFFKATGGSRGLYVPKNGSFQVIVQDNLSGLPHFHMHIQGYLVEG